MYKIWVGFFISFFYSLHMFFWSPMIMDHFLWSSDISFPCLYNNAEPSSVMFFWQLNYILYNPKICCFSSSWFVVISLTAYFFWGCALTTLATNGCTAHIYLHLYMLFIICPTWLLILRLNLVVPCFGVNWTISTISPKDTACQPLFFVILLTAFLLWQCMPNSHYQWLHHSPLSPSLHLIHYVLMIVHDCNRSMVC